MKNLETVYQMSKTDEEDEGSKEGKIYIYDEKHLLTYMENIKSLTPF